MNPYYSRYYTFIKPIIRDKRVKTYAPLIFSLILSIIFAIFAIKPSLAAIASLQKSIAEKKEVLSKLETKANNLSEGRKNYQNLSDNGKQKLEKLIPNKTDISGLVNALTSLANENQASISGLQFQPTVLTGTPKVLVNNTKLDEVSFTLNITGTYQNTVSLLDALNFTSRLLILSSVTMNKQEGTALTRTINGKAFVLK